MLNLATQVLMPGNYRGRGEVKETDVYLCSRPRSLKMTSHPVASPSKSLEDEKESLEMRLWWLYLELWVVGSIWSCGGHYIERIELGLTRCVCSMVIPSAPSQWIGTYPD